MYPEIARYPLGEGATIHPDGEPLVYTNFADWPQSSPTGRGILLVLQHAHE